MTLESPRTVEVGRYYQVPCVQMKKWGKAYFPVIGPLHEDKEFLDFPWQHWHCDFRFISDRFADKLCKGREKAYLLAQVVAADTTALGPILKKKLCQRPMPDFPWSLLEWQRSLGKLEIAYAKHHINVENPICPHRGLPLVAPPDKRGVTVCSGHGLSWDLHTGALVCRASKNFSEREVLP